MKITLADHFGMCFGVRDALRKTHDLASHQRITILGELVHNPIVRQQLAGRGVEEGNLEQIGTAPTRHVVITAHGAADQDRQAWRNAGFEITDTTCPLVRKAHAALAELVAAGFLPVVIGQSQHVEVRGLIGDFPEAVVIESEADLPRLRRRMKIGIVSQTTQPLDHVLRLVAEIRRQFPESHVQFRDTVCHPTKDRQAALEKLCRENEVVVVVGGRNSNNTRQLVHTAQRLGAAAHQVETAAELESGWFRGVERVGVTAGTSTLDETVREVVESLQRL